MNIGKDAAGWDAIRIAPNDHVAVALRDLSGRARVRQGDQVVGIALTDPIPLGHKFALAALPADSEICKYGVPIGRLTQPVLVGAHVHVHNLVSQRAMQFPATKR